MDADLKALEEKVSRLIALCQSLRDENVQLRQDLAQAEDDSRQLRDNMARATAKLEALIDRLPVETIAKESI